MREPPSFLSAPLELGGEESFQPSKLPLRGAIFAWGSSGLLAVAIVLQIWRTGQSHCVTIALFVFFFFAALLIIFSRWVDSRTQITVNLTSISYRSPFRVVSLNWDEILEIRSIQAGHGWRVAVQSNESPFSFRVPASPQPNSSAASILALPRGTYLTQIICGMARLTEPEYQDQEWVCHRPR